MTDPNKRIAFVCNSCGSDDVSRDAWADWDTREQQWVLRCAFDYAHCHRCDCETRLFETELTGSRHSAAGPVSAQVKSPSPSPRA